MKRIAIFCDGTWNSLNTVYQTNVVHLAEAVLPRASDGVAQHVIYQPGVGTRRDADPASRLLDRVLGGAFGNGLTANIEDAYKNLMLSYEPGDHIYVFGFSRGAYTARSLVGMIRACGVLPRRRLSQVDEAMDYYRSRDVTTNPRDIESIAWRARMSPDVATSIADQNYRRQNGLPEGTLLNIAYMGIWDTVGERGVPSVFGLLARVVNSIYQFHDAQLSSMVQAARHAVAIDERRRLYPPALWDNLDYLNGGATGTDRLLQQLWFAGNHSAVGGGGDLRGLSSITLNWVADGARAARLELDPVLMANLVATANPLAPLSGTTQAGFLSAILALLKADRTGIDGTLIECADVAPPAHQRAETLAGYRPKTIRHCT